MKEAALREKLYELTDLLEALHSSGVKESKNSDSASFNAYSSKYTSIDDAINHLSLQIKYILFDLEATRRENRYLRQTLEARPRDDKDKGPKGL